MKFTYILLVFSLLMVPCSEAYGAHGLSMDGTLKYPDGFDHFDYVNPAAEKNGELILHSIGSFDKMNPFTLKGNAPDLLETLVFEPLAQTSLDEPFSQYGLLASDIAVADDNLSVTFTIDPRAKFSDGSSVTAEDVKFTVDTLKSEAVHPFYPYYYADIKEAVILDRGKIKIYLKQENRELPLIIGQIAVMSKSFYEKNGFSNREMIAPVGSGPYFVESFSQGRSVTYKRNPHYWAADHPARKGMYNFDRITVKYFKDQTVALEAFKAGDFDVMLVNIAKQWVRDLKGEKIDSGQIIKRKFVHHNDAGMQGFVFNTRRPFFKDPVVRKALGLAFDFEWTNRTLFYNQYVRSDSYFSNSYLAARGLPSEEELKLFEPIKDQVPKEVFTTPLTPPSTAGKGGIRRNLREAAELLRSAGWEVKDGVLQNGEGTRLSFEITLVSQSFERVMAGYVDNLKRLGVEASYRTIDPALYTDRINNFDFDMCVFTFGQSLSPGNEQRNFWESGAAGRKGSRNLAGIRDPAVDYLVEKIIYAKDRQELEIACHALDRTLWYGYYVVPNWYLNGHRIAFHNKFGIPKTLPTYYDYLSFVMTWWIRK